MKSNIKNIVIGIVIAVIFFFLGKNLYQNWSQIPFGELHFNFLFLGIAFALAILCLPIASVGWILILRGFNENLDIRKAMGIGAIARLGDYIPGKFMPILGTGYLAKKHGISYTNSISSALLSTVFSYLGLFLVILFFLVFQTGQVVARFSFLMLLIPICLVVTHPRVISKVVKIICKVAKKTPPQINFRYSHNLPILGIYMLLALTNGIWFYFLVLSVHPQVSGKFIELVSSYLISRGAGYVVFIFPHGMGINEATLSLLLKPYLPVPLPVAIAILARLLATLGDIMCPLLFGRWVRKKK